MLICCKSAGAGFLISGARREVGSDAPNGSDPVGAWPVGPMFAIVVPFISGETAMKSLTVARVDGQYFSAHYMFIEPWDQVMTLNLLIG